MRARLEASTGILVWGLLGLLLYACTGESLTGPDVHEPPAEPEVATPASAPAASTHPQPVLAPDRVCGDETSVDLLAGRDVPVGEVTVTNDDERLSVVYRLEDGWELVETHLSVTDDVASVATTPSGQPQPGRFPDSGDHDPGTTAARHDLTLDGLEGVEGDRLVVAAHADVLRPGDPSDPEDDRREGAWADGDRFTEGGSWATYFQITVQGCRSVTEVVDSDGGTVVAEGATVTIPPGALDGEVAITVEPVGEDELDELDLTEEERDALVTGAIVDLGPDGEEFEEPVEVTVGYDETLLGDGFDESDLRIAVVTDDLELLDSSVDTDANEVTASTTHFTFFGVVEPLLLPIELVIEEAISVTDEATTLGSEELVASEAVTVSDEVIVELGPPPIDLTLKEEVVVADEVTIELGPAPIDLTVNESVAVSDEVNVELGPTPSSGDFAYVALQGEDAIAVIDRSTQTVTSKISVGQFPYAVTVRPDGSEVYVTNRGDGSVSVIDVATQTLAATITGVVNDPIDVAFSPDGTTAYVVDNDASLIGVIDASSRSIATRFTGTTRFSRAIAVTASGDSAFVAAEDSLVVFDLAGGVASDTVVGTFGSAGAHLTRAGSELWLTDSRDDELLVFDRDTRTVAATLTGILTPRGIDVDEVDGRAYVADRGFALTPIDIATRSVGSDISLSFRPHQLAVSEDGTLAYVTEERGGTRVAVVDLETGAVITTLNAGSGPAGVALTP